MTGKRPSEFVRLTRWAASLLKAVGLGYVARRRDPLDGVAYGAVFDAHPQPIVLADAETMNILAVNNAANELYGYTDQQFAELVFLDLVCPREWPQVRAAWAEAGGTAGFGRQLGVHVARDGTRFPVEVLATTLELDGRRVRMTVVADVTHREDTAAESRESRERYGQIFEAAHEGIMTVDTDQIISSANQHGAEMLGYTVDELVGHAASELYGPGGAEPNVDSTPRMPGGSTVEHETTMQRKDGTPISVLVSETPLVDRAGGYAGELGIVTDLTERKRLEGELAFQATHDPLTGLPSRLLLTDNLGLALGRATHHGSHVAVVFVNIDGFSQINTGIGHDGGDELLKEAARRLCDSVREQDTVARFGSDEFVVVSGGTGAFAEQLAERLATNVVASPYDLEEGQVHVTASMGVAVGGPGERPSKLLHEARLALAHAKAAGGNRTDFFTAALRATSKRRHAIMSDLPRAVEHGEFSLRFQPVVSLADERIVGAEALIRWEHPRRGTLSPQDFIAVAEETGLIEPIGDWVIEETCRRLAGWQALAPDLSVSLNVSARQLTGGILDTTVRDAIAASCVDASHLALEITESVLMDDVDQSVAMLAKLRATGVIISVDDFGTGYSSLSYLNKFPVDVLKIDRSFVAGLPDNTYDVALVQAVLAIADALDLGVIAEGVETKAQAANLLSLGCKKAQGFLFHRPLTVDDFEAQLSRSSTV
jgi:diguanylate cyclase (GGDEF)-like protein/PAS domain S-box-containing protein